MDRKGHMPEYKITDDILSMVAELAGKIPVLDGGSAHVLHHSMPSEREWQKQEPVYRQKGTGVFAGEHLLCRAPLPQYVEDLMQELEDWLDKSRAHALIKSAIVLYQYVMIQPFEGDNACYGIERAAEILFEWRPQLTAAQLSDAWSGDGFIKALEQSDLYGEVGPFIAYFLEQLSVALDGMPKIPLTMQPQSDAEVQVVEKTRAKEPDEKVERLIACMGEGTYSTKELMELLGLKHRPTFRDNYLLPAMARGLVEMTIPDRPNSSQQRYRKRS